MTRLPFTGGGMKRRPSVKLGGGPLGSVSFWVRACLELLEGFSGSVEFATCWKRVLGLGSLLASFGLEGS